MKVRDAVACGYKGHWGRFILITVVGSSYPPRGSGILGLRTRGRGWIQEDCRPDTKGRCSYELSVTETAHEACAAKPDRIPAWLVDVSPTLAEELLAGGSCLEKVCFPQGVAPGKSATTQDRPRSQEYLNSINWVDLKKIGSKNMKLGG